MYKLFVTAGLIALNASLTLALPIQAQEVQTQKDCAATIAYAQSTIETGRNVQIIIRSSDISNEPDHPDNRPYNYSFSMGGNASTSVMNSPEFMKILATKVINNCSSVASVTFGIEGSDYVSTLGLMPNGSVEGFKCIEPGEFAARGWGYKTCL